MSPLWSKEEQGNGVCCGMAIINRVGVVTYRMQLIGSPKTLVVHRNKLKLCYGEPQGKVSKKQPTPVLWKKGSGTTYLIKPQRQSQRMWKSWRTNKKLDQLEDTQLHQTNYPLRRKDHSVITDHQYFMEIILLTEFITFYWFCEDTKLVGEWCSVYTVLLYL